MKKPAITIVGSFAVGLTIRVPRLPVKGETLIGCNFNQGPGGKGSNQAVQAARLGCNVEFIGMIGDDHFGEIALDLFAREGVGTSFLYHTTDCNTGVGFIIVDDDGNNLIALDPGANRLLRPEHVEQAAETIRRSDVLITQLEIPVESAAYALDLGNRVGVLTVLNPAPAQQLPLEVFRAVRVLTPNETEAKILTGRSPDEDVDPLQLCEDLLDLGVNVVVLTMGAKGAFVVSRDTRFQVPAFKVDVLDSTGAGDSFTATLAVSLAQGLDLKEAVQRAAAAGALTCTKIGVIPALPRKEELDSFLGGVLS